MVTWTFHFLHVSEGEMFVKEYAKSLVITSTNFTMTMLKGLIFPYESKNSNHNSTKTYTHTKIKKLSSKWKYGQTKQQQAPKGDTKI